MKKLTFLLLALLPLLAAAETLHFPYNPSLSPNGETIYFSYDGDIFNVPAKGGLAMRLVSLGGAESNPKVSPCGKYIAFASDIQGNNDVYIVPVAGGDVKRLTWHEGNDVPSGWSKDSKYVYFETDRANGKTTYKVSVDGATPVRLLDGYFNTIVNVAENPVTGEFYFNESNESRSFPTRKHYVGDHNPNVKSWNPANGEYRELTSYEGKDAWPMADKNGNLYYVTDRFNRESNIAKHNPAGDPVQLTSFGQSVQYPSVSFNGNAMVFILEYKIHYLDLATGKVVVPQIAVADNNVDIERQVKDVAPSTVAVSPDGKKFALSLRGLLYVSDAEGKYQHKLPTPEFERVDEIVWGKDNNTIYYTRTDKGFTALYSIKADGSAAEKLLCKADCNIKNLEMSHKKDKIAFVQGNKSIMCINLSDGKVGKLADAEFWSFNRYTLNFSFDDSHLAFEAMNLFERDIYLYSFKDKQLHNLTNSACSEGAPVFSPCGKYLFLGANLQGSTFPRGGGAQSVYRLPLMDYNTKPFKSDIYDKLFEAPANDAQVEKEAVKGKKGGKKGKDAAPQASEKKSPAAPEVKVDYNDVFRRMEKMDFKGGRSLYTFKSKEKEWLIVSGWEGVQALELSDPYAEVKTIKDLKRGMLINSDKDLFAVSGADIYKVDLNSGRATKVATIKKSVEKNLKDEFGQMFYEAWGLMDQNFYDVNFHGADWKAKRDYYASFLPYVRSRANLSTLFNDMLGELNSSHLGFRSAPGLEHRAPQTRIYSAETGIIWDNGNPYMVERTIVGSPAHNVDTDVRKGDVLVAVNGERVTAGANRESYLASSVQQPEVKFTFSRGGKEFDVKIHTISYGALKNLLYTEWESINRARVDKLGNGRIGYTHMRAMSAGDLENFLVDMHTRMVGKEALILDLRYNNGGNVHKEVLDFLTHKAHFNWAFRDNRTNAHPNVTLGDIPVVALVNERSLSDAEVTSNGIKTLGLATIVGTETYRWIIFTSGATLIDGTSLRLPAWGCYSLDGKDLEVTGVKPDIYVKNTAKDRNDGKDPQLVRGIEEILRQLDK
jgi:tricorn protease